MITLALIIFVCIVSASVLFKNITPSILGWNMGSTPTWLANTIKITLSFIVTAAIIVGTVCMFIVMLACSTGGSNTK